jgi:hypothetical protein
MENKKNIDLFEWVAKIIDTCNHDFHFEAVDNLITLYYEKSKDEAKMIELKQIRQDKWNQIHNILF